MPLVFLVDDGTTSDDSITWIITVPDEYADLENELALVLPWVASGEDMQLIGVGHNWNFAPDYEGRYGIETFESLVKGYWPIKHPLIRRAWINGRPHEIKATPDVVKAADKILERVPEEWLK